MLETEFLRLNSQQRDAVMHEKGPLLVLAGAGSGKTKVITSRIARLVTDGVASSRIAAVTFTNKAAVEMRERIHGVLRSQAKGLTISTFHSLGLLILKQEYKAANLRRGFCIYDRADQVSLVRELMRRTTVSDRRLDVQKVLEILLKTKKNGLTEVQIDWADDYEFAAYELYPKYLEQMKAFNAVDFDDLLILARKVLEIPEVAQRWMEKYDYLLVDEYQDTSPDQMKLLEILGAVERNVCVVGDDDQSIYSWRGAAAENILRFEKNFPGAKTVILDQNYRSTTNILEAANAVIKNNKSRKLKHLWSDLGVGDPVEVVTCLDGDDESEFVSSEIGKMGFQGVSYNSMAILYRANTQARIFEELLALNKIPFKVVGGQSVYDRKEIKDILAYLSLLVNPNDEVSLRRIVNTPPRGIGPTTVERLTNYAEAVGCPLYRAMVSFNEIPELKPAARASIQQFLDFTSRHSDSLKNAELVNLPGAIDAMLSDINYREFVYSSDDSPGVATRRVENLNAFMRSVERFCQSEKSSGGLEEFVRLSRLVKEEKDEQNEESVTLMTLHGAKGLEFDNVFMVGVEEELLPHKKTIDDAGGDLSEERRLCYVGMTRARRKLWMCYTQNRNANGSLTQRSPSRFLEELPEGDGVRRWSRKDATDDENSEAMAEKFFSDMKAKIFGNDDTAHA
ncbi:MAG: UvrD-helicase domain-containing protein [Myxococcota bacterium]|nr:UvrD-helicase domain-containing protein [Myxococcota bacterium]